jgi:hypothetical protein
MAERIADRASIPWDTAEMPEEDAKREGTFLHVLTTDQPQPAPTGEASH